MGDYKKLMTVESGEYFDEDGKIVKPFKKLSMTTMGTDERGIIEGREFITEQIFDTIAASSSEIILFRAQGTDAKFRFSEVTGADASLDFKIVEADSVTEGTPTVETPVNLNRKSSQTSNLIVKTDIDSYVSGTIIKKYIMHAAKKGSGGVKTGKGTEIILKKNTDYIIEITNLSNSTAATNVVLSNIFREPIA